MIPKSLEKKCNELAMKWFGDFPSHIEVCTEGYEEGFNAAVTLILESDELKGLVDGLEVVKLDHVEGSNMTALQELKHSKLVATLALSEWLKFVGSND